MPSSSFANCEKRAKFARPSAPAQAPFSREFRAGSDVPSISFGLDAASLVSRQGCLNSCFQITLNIIFTELLKGIIEIGFSGELARFIH